jgi:hypothetical protein
VEAKKGERIGMILLLIIAVLAGLVILGFRLLDESEFWGCMVIVPASIVLVILLFIWPDNYYKTKAAVANYNAVKATVEDARLRPKTDLERAALTQKIIDINTDLATARYWNNTIFDWYIADEYAELEPLK